MNRMLSGCYLSAFEAHSRDDLFCTAKDFALQMGFSTFGVAAVIDDARGNSKFVSVDNVPRAYQAAHDDPALGKIDPVMQHCRVSSAPIVWNQSTYVKADRAEKWEHQAGHGFDAASTSRCTSQGESIS